MYKINACENLACSNAKAATLSRINYTLKPLHMVEYSDVRWLVMVDDRIVVLNTAAEKDGDITFVRGYKK